MKKLLILLAFLLLPVAVNAQSRPCQPEGGCTGTSTRPTYGQMLVGNAGGTYTLTSTSSLGITGSADGTFSTTSADFWKSVNNFFSTTSAEYFVNSSTTIPKGVPTLGNVLLGDGTNWTSVATTSLGITGGGSQTPWTSNINGGGFTLTNVSAAGIGTSTITSGTELVIHDQLGVSTLDVTGASSQIRVAQSTTIASGVIAMGFSSPCLGLFRGTLGCSNALLYYNTSTGFNHLNVTFSGASLTGSISGTEHFRLSGATATLGNFGIGTTSPYAKLSVVGEVVARNFNATSTTATSTFSGSVISNDYYSSDGSRGITATCTILSITAITVKNGLITACN